MKNDEDALEKIDGFILLTLMRGCDDWVDACEIVDNIFNIDSIFKKRVSNEILDRIALAEKKGGSEEFEIARKLSILIIRKLLSEDLMLVGDIYDMFIPWGLSTEESLNKIENIWDGLNGQLPGLGIYWLCNTVEGDKIGQKVLLQWHKTQKKKEICE